MQIVIKLPDEKSILDSLKKTGCMVTAEEHNFLELLSEKCLKKIKYASINASRISNTKDTFGKSSTPEQLID